MLHSTEFDYDEGGALVVSLANSSDKARIDETDFEELMRIGVKLPWRVIGNRVVARCGSGNNDYLSIARVILDCGPDTQVRFSDGSPFNLTRANLIRFDGFAKQRTRDRLNG
jgi:hypothetical protein